MTSIIKQLESASSQRSQTLYKLRFLHAPAVIYWLGFLFFNLFLFLPLYLFNLQDATFLPHGTWRDLFISRSNQDIFRLSLEISILLLIYPFIVTHLSKKSQKRYARTFYAIFIFALIYAIYETVTISLYHSTPVLFNDYRFFVGGIGFLLDGLRLAWWQLILIILVIVGVPWLLFQLTVRWFSQLPFHRLGLFTNVVAVLLLFYLVTFAVLQRHALAQTQTVVESLSAKLLENTRASIAARNELKIYTDIQPETVYNYSETSRLFQHPNIYLIFIESYGSVLYKRPHFKDDYLKLMREMQARLEDQGWAVETGLSTSPTWGGGSWMAYTSTEFGLHIGSQPQFLAIKDQYTHQPYPSLGRYLQSQGYKTVRLAPIERKLTPSEQKGNEALYGPDQWIYFSDLAYQGPLYGWGPSPPDQFSLNKARELLQTDNHKPQFFFYLTQNSHYPWAPLPPYQADWRSLNNPDWKSPSPISEPISHRDNIKHYRDAIRYQWETLSAFILSTPEDEDAIFILIGDHQPPRVSRHADGFETPVHIIARDKNFVHRFESYGFESGLIVSDLEPDIKHEGFYSMFLRELVDAFGVSTTTLPYLESGIELGLPTPTPTPTHTTYKESSP